MLLKYIEQQVKIIRRGWQTHRQKIAKEIPLSHRAILENLDDIFIDATSKLLKDLQSPTLTIVTTGTTSSGKSTLVNLLCGAEIIPVAVQEMSAGLVTIEHSQNTAIHIEHTYGALWDCGDWYHPSDLEIYDRLAAVMNSYLQAKYNGVIDISYPQIQIQYPIRLLAPDSRLQLPKIVKFRIIDLPGLSHQEDMENLSLLKICNRALFLVTYNSAETDKQKVNVLLQGVVEQLKIISGLSKNIWFLFNRIDVFYGDKDRIDSEEKFIDRTKIEINRLLTKYNFKIEAGQAVKISTMPALLSLLMRSTDENKRIKAASRLDRNFNFLIPDKISENLPRSPAKWSTNDCDRVSSAIWNISYADKFEQLLSDNIQTNLVDLIFLPIIREFERELCLKITDWADRTIDRDPICNLIKSESINYVKDRNVRLLNRLNWAIKISMKFRQISNCFKKIWQS